MHIPSALLFIPLVHLVIAANPAQPVVDLGYAKYQGVYDATVSPTRCCAVQLFHVAVCRQISPLSLEFDMLQTLQLTHLLSIGICRVFTDLHSLHRCQPMDSTETAANGRWHSSRIATCPS